MLTLPQNKVEAKAVILSARLSAIADSLVGASVICDVGSDHGALPLYLLQRGECSSVIVTDLNEKPLERAKLNLRQAGVIHKATFVLTDGIDAVLPLAPDAFVIAGMGGETILGILKRGLERIPKGTLFVLQPMTKVATLRRFLYEFGFFVCNETLISENDKFFIVIRAIYDGVIRPDKSEFYDYGEYLPQDRGETAKAYFSSMLSSLKVVISGKKKAGVCCDRELKKFCQLQTILEGINENQRD